MTGYFDMALPVSDGSLGWDASVPDDAILVTGAGPGVPKSLLSQLAHDGRMILSIGGMI